MRVDIKGLARDMAQTPRMTRYWYYGCPEYQSDYLMDHFLLPALRGEPIYVNELDLDAFTMDELGDIEEFLEKHDRISTIRVPCELGDMARSALPKVKAGRAFC